MNDEKHNEIVIEGEYVNITDSEEDIESQIEGIFQEIGESPDNKKAKGHVKRVIPDLGELEHCFSFTSYEDGILEKIRHSYGAGLYQISIYKGNKIFKKPTIRIAEPIGNAEGSMKNIQISDQYPAIHTLHQSLFAIEKKISRIEDRNLVESTDKKTPLDIPALIVAGTAAITAIGTLIPKKDTLGDRIKELQALNGIKDIKKDDEGGNSTSQEEFIKAFAPAMGEIAKILVDRYAKNPQQQDMAQQPQPQQQQTAQQPQPQQPQQPQQSQNNQEERSEAERMASFQIQVNELVDKAKRKCNPELYADLILDIFPMNEIKGFMDKGDPIQNLTIINPEVANYREWFEEFFTALQEIMVAQIAFDDEEEAKAINKVQNTDDKDDADNNISINKEA